MSAELVFHCPHCEHPLSVEDSAAGLAVDCPVCSREITVPTESEAAAMAAADAAEDRPETGARPVADLPPRRERSSAAAASRTKLPEKKGGQSRDLAAVARGAQAGRVQPVRGGWQGFCPSCGDPFLFSGEEARRGLQTACAKCRSTIRVLGGDPPQLELVSHPVQGHSGGATAQVPPRGGDRQDLRSALGGGDVSQEQIEAARERAARMSGAKDEWLWLRLGILVLMILLAVFLFVSLLDLRQRGQSQDALTRLGLEPATVAITIR